MTTKIGRTEYVTATEAAKLAGIARDTFTAYVSRGLAPAAALELAGRKFYKLATINRWIGNRPGRGARTDLKRPRASTKGIK